MQRDEVWAKIGDTGRDLEVETPVGVLAARAAEVNVRLVQTVIGWSRPLLP